MVQTKGTQASGARKAANHYIIRFVPYLSILLPFGISLFYVHLFGVNVFFSDEWELVGYLRRFHAGTLGVVDLFEHHNEHVYFFPWIVMLLLGTLTEYNTIPLMYLVQICLLFTSIILLLAFGSTVRKTSPLMVLFVPIPLLVFSFRQYENMLWGNQITFAFAQMFSVLTLFLLQALQTESSKRAVFFPVALVSATIASFSAVQGLLVWPAGLLQLFLITSRGLARRLLIGTWGLVGIAEWIVYFVGYTKSRSSPPLYFVLDHPIVGLDYFLTLLGGSLFWQDAVAFSGGLLLVCLTVVGLGFLYKDREIQNNSFWVALLSFSLLSLASITIGRSGFPEEKVFAQALASRFTAFSILAVVSLYALLAQLARERKSHVSTALFGIMLGIVLVSVPTSLSTGIVAGAATKASREQAASILSTYERQSDAALAVFGWNPQRVRIYARTLDRLDYSIFAERVRNGSGSRVRTPDYAQRPVSYPSGHPRALGGGGLGASTSLPART